MTTTPRSRTAHLLRLLSLILAAFATTAICAPAAFARVDPDGPYPYPATMPAPSAASTAATTHVASGSGPATWLVVVLAISLLAAGAALAELTRSVLQNRRVPGPVAVTS